jgi:hypothetical protein
VRSGTISLREFKATFSTVVCELEFKYDVNYIKAFAFKQLARYVHYEALDVYEQHSLRILGVTQIPNLAYATTIATTSQAALQAAIAHHGTMPNNPNPVLISINLSPQQLIVALQTFFPPSMHQLFTDLVGEFFQVLQLEFPIKISKKNLQLTTFSWQKDETLKMLYKRLSSLKRIFTTSQTWKLCIGIFVRWKVFQHSMCRFCNGFLQNLETRTLCWMCTTFLRSWNWLMHTMRPVL